MKIYGIKDVNKFLETVGECEGRVELVSENGDRLNLKSKLSQFVAAANLFSENSSLKDIEIQVSNPEDSARMINYMMCLNAS